MRWLRIYCFWVLAERHSKTHHEWKYWNHYLYLSQGTDSGNELIMAQPSLEFLHPLSSTRLVLLSPTKRSQHGRGRKSHLATNSIPHRIASSYILLNHFLWAIFPSFPSSLELNLELWCTSAAILKTSLNLDTLSRSNIYTSLLLLGFCFDTLYLLTDAIHYYTIKLPILRE